MARAYDSNTLAALASGRFETRDLLIARWGEQVSAVWNDVFDASFADYPGVTFVGIGGFIEITDIVQTLSSEVSTLSITVNPMDSKIITAFGSVPLHQVELTLARAAYDVDTRALLSVITLFEGAIERDEHEVSGDRVFLKYRCVTRSREMSRSTLRTRSDADQRRVLSTDKFYEFAPKAGARFDFGRASPSGRSAATL